ncbi:MAG: outer membrane beta-barrel protein [Muribaculaceae bacterium]|nr:outer membrane beta-barrel protein [Muribaculaceae bacterium]
MKKSALLFLLCSPLMAYGQYEREDSVMSRELREVTVKGEKPQIKSQDGVLVVDLPAIVRDKPVTNVLEALGYVPGVVSENGGIGLNGASGVTILLNGELTNMPVGNLYQLLYSTPVDRLKNVEIMYAAPAKYHVSGAVINIVLKTPRPIDGLTGQLQAGFSQAHYPSCGGGLAATYAMTDWTFDVNWSISRNKTWSRQETFSNHLFNGVRTMVEDDMRQVGRDLSNLVYASVGYKTLKLTYNGQVKSNASSSSLSTGTFGDYVNDYAYCSPAAYHNLSVRYTAPFGLSVGGDYTAYGEDREQLLRKEKVCLVEGMKRQSITRYHAYADQEHQFGRWQLNYGVEYQHSDDHSMQSFTIPAHAGFDDVLKEDVADAYAGVQASLEWGLSFSASAKGEYYHNDYRSSWNFVPQLSATYYKTPKSIFQLNLTSQRVYPQYWELHGGTSYVNEYSTIKGNPALQPYMKYAGQLSYIYRQKYAATLYVLYSDKYSVQLPYQQPDDLQLLFQTVNFDYSRTVGLQLNVPFNAGDVLKSTAVGNILNKREKASHFHDIGFDNQRWSFYGALNNTITFAPGCPVSLSVDVSYVTGQIQGPGRFNSFWKMDAGAKWRFGKNRCCEIDVKCNDIFNTWNPRLTINSNGQDYRMLLHEMVSSFTASFVWRFNGFKPKDSSVDTSRFGTGG